MFSFLKGRLYVPSFISKSVCSGKGVVILLRALRKTARTCNDMDDTQNIVLSESSYSRDLRTDLRLLYVGRNQSDHCTREADGGLSRLRAECTH